MEATFSSSDFPHSGPFQPSSETILLATNVAAKVDDWAEEDEDLVGVGLFELKGAVLKPWVPRDIDLNFAMDAAYEALLKRTHPMGDTLGYCNALLKDSGVQNYLTSAGAQWVNHQVIVHVHYYRNRLKEDNGFHKDTRGQTLFFMLHYLNERPIYGAEWRHDLGDLRRLNKRTGWTRAIHVKTREQLLLDEANQKVYRFGPPTPFKGVVPQPLVYYSKKLTKTGHRRVIHKATGKMFLWKESTKELFEQGQPMLVDVPPDELQTIGRGSPATDETVWPEDLRQAVERSRGNDRDTHVLRIEPYGAALIVDDVINHRTPSRRTRSEWPNKSLNGRETRAPQLVSVQAYDAAQRSHYYTFEERGRARTREPQRESSPSRSLSRERKVAEKDDKSAEAQRWAATFNGEPRRFFRIWVTVSPTNSPVWY